jgi:hypothetical protein
MSTFTEQLQLGKYIMWHFMENEENEDIRTAAAGFIFLTSPNMKEKGQEAFWVRPTLSQRKIYDSDELLIDLRNDEIGLSGELRSSFKNFQRTYYFI